MGDLLKQLYTVKSLSLGWSVAWRSMLIYLAHFVIIMILAYLLQNVPAILGIFNLIAMIVMLAVALMATGWAAQRIKDRL